MINESALVRAMKREYKCLGYDITNATDRLYIRGGIWFAEIPWASVPGKVLGLIAEHMRGMPEPGETIHLQNGEEPQAVMEDVAAGDLQRWLNEKINRSGEIVRTIFHAGTLVLFQNPYTWQSYGVPEYVADIADATMANAETYEDGRCRWVMEDGILTAMCFRPEFTGGVIYNPMLRLWDALDTTDLLTQ